MPVNKITAKNYTELELRKARKMGFKKKKPTKPKRSASVTKKELYLAKFNDFVDDVKMWAAEYERDQRLQGIIDGIGKPKIKSAPVRRSKKRTKRKVSKKRKK